MVGYVAAPWLLLLVLYTPAALAANNIGCLFSDTLCEQDREWCFDDHAFGHCLPSYGHYTEEDLYRYELGSEQLRLLEQEMQRLFLLGYRWSHTYTQCVLQKLLRSIRRGALEDVDGEEAGKEFDISSCNGDLDQDLEGALRAIEGEELVDPRDLAIVRFTPSATDPHSDYADEVYFPPIKDPNAPPPHPTSSEDGEERSDEDGGERRTGRGNEGEDEGGRGGEDEGGEEDNSLSPMPSHNLPPPPAPPPPDIHPSADHEDDRALNYISYYDDPGYQNDVYQSPYNYQHNPVFGKRSNFFPRPRPEQDQNPSLNYLPFLRKFAGALDDLSREGGPGRYQAQESVVFPSHFQNQPQQDLGIFGETPARPVYTEGGLQFMPQLEREREMFGPDVDEVDEEGGIWSNDPLEVRATPVGIPPGFGDQQVLARNSGDLRGFAEQRNIPEKIRNLPGDIRGIGKQRSMSGDQRGFEKQQNMAVDRLGFGEQNLPGDLGGYEKPQNLAGNLFGYTRQQNIPDGIRGFGEQQNLAGDIQSFGQQNIPGDLHGYREQNLPGDIRGYGEQRSMSEDTRSMSRDLPGFGKQQYLPENLGKFGGQQDLWSYPSDLQNFRDQQEDVWNYPDFIDQRNPIDLGYRESRPALFDDLRNFGQRRTLPEDLRNMGGGMYSSLSDLAPPRYRDLSRASPLMMVAEEEVYPPDNDRFSGYQSMFGSQLNQLVGPVSGYGRNVMDYQDYQDYQDFQDFQDYQDYDQDPSQLTQKFVKKDEETVGSDYGDLTTGWNLPRSERQDVKKPGPNFRSENDFAFDYPQQDVAFLGSPRRMQQDVSMSIMLARLQEGDPREDQEGALVPLPSAIDSPLPDLLLAEEGLVVAEGDGAPHTQAIKEEEDQSQEGGGEKEEEDEEEEKKKEQKQLEKEEGMEKNEELNEASPSAIQPNLVIITTKQSLSKAKGRSLVRKVGEDAGLMPDHLIHFSVEGNVLQFAVRDNEQGITAADLVNTTEKLRGPIKDELDLDIEDVTAPNQINTEALPTAEHIVTQEVRSGVGQHVMAAAAVVCGVTAAVAVAAGVLFLLRRHAHSKSKLPLLASPHTQDSKDYEDLCRARMSGKGGDGGKGGGDTTPVPASGHPPSQRVSSLSRDSDNGNNSPSSRSSTSSWSEEPVISNMDISTGHMVLSYMEDHLKNKDRLEQEWIALCAYEAEPCASTLALKPENQQKNRYPDAVPYDHNRVHLNAHANISGSDYINASSITDHDPRNPAYIATQGPLETTAADFWQLVWEQGSVVIVMLTRLTENGHSFCYRYWPEEGSDLYHIYEVHLVSEHIWCDDYLVRSFYLKNVRTGETRTVTQFHFLSWHESGTPASTKALLEFRRKVNKSYRGRSCPIIVHCSDGIGRAGTYCLIDMVLNRMAKGAKEIDIAATLEHIRDQRPHMVRSKAQFEFVLMAVAEEVHAILKALPQ